MLEHYYRRRKRLVEIKSNPLAPFLEQAAAHYCAEGYVHNYAQGALGCAATFGKWLRVHRIPPDRITDQHLDSFLNWFVPSSSETSTNKRKQALAATRFVLTLIRARYPVVSRFTPVEAEVRRYVEHLRRDRGLAEDTLEYHQRHLEKFLTFCFKQGNVDYATITPARIHAYVADYLAKGRPSSLRREIFVRHARPHGTAVTAGALKREVQRAWQRSGLEKRFSGTHVLRHSVATRMKQKGVSLKFIADVLGHESVQTTTLYAQVDLPVLRTVAQPWPEELS